MASNRHAAGEDTFGPYDSYDPYGSYGDTSYGSHAPPGQAYFGTAPAGAADTAVLDAPPADGPAPDPAGGGPVLVADDELPPSSAYFGTGPDQLPGDDGGYGEWNPGTETLRPVRGRHRVVRQRGGTVARSRAVLGVGVIAAVGAGGMATAHEDGAPGVGDAVSKVRAMPGQLTSLGGLLGGGKDSADPDQQGSRPVITAAPLTSAGLVAVDDTAAATDAGRKSETAAGEALRSRILQQAEKQDAIAEEERVEAAVDAAITSASEDAAALAEEERIAEEERKRAEEERKRKEEEERKRREEEERLAKLRASYMAPLSNYKISATYGQSGAMWATGYHTGLDLASPAGTPVKNIHTGTVKEAAWAGSYGYQVIVELEDGTEVSYSHLSSMSVTAGQELITGDLIGNVGSTGNSSGPHLHIEVRPGGGDTVDPLAWLRNNGVEI